MNNGEGMYFWQLCQAQRKQIALVQVLACVKHAKPLLNFVEYSFSSLACHYHHYCSQAIVYQSRALNVMKFDALRWLLRPFLGLKTSFWILSFSPGMVTEF